MNGLEARPPQAPLVLLDENGSGDAANISQQITTDLRRQWLFERNVAYGHPAAGLEDPEHFPKYRPLVLSQVDDAIADKAIDGITWQRKLVDGGQMIFDVFGKPAIGGLHGVLAGKFDHLRGHVDADGLARGTNLGRRQQNVQPAPAAEIHDRFAGPQTGKDRWVAAT